MKLFWKIALVITCVALIGNAVLLLQNKNLLEKKPDPSEKEYHEKIFYRVGYDSAKQWIDNYKNDIALREAGAVRSFTISRQDFLQAIEIDTMKTTIKSKFRYVRAYFGLQTDPTTGKKLCHVYFTPAIDVIADSLGNISNAGKDVILSGKYGNMNRQTSKLISSQSEEEGEYMLELNAPCPTTCPN